MGPRELLGETIDVVEVAVGLVLVLLLQFHVIEVIVVEPLVGWGFRAGTANCGVGGGGSGRAKRIGQVRVFCSQIRKGSKAQASETQFTSLVLLVSSGSETGWVTTSGVQRALASRNPHRLDSRDPGGARGEALGATETSTLHSQSLAHDRAAATQNLQVGHSSASRAGARTSSG